MKKKCSLILLFLLLSFLLSSLQVFAESELPTRIEHMIGSTFLIDKPTKVNESIKTILIFDKIVNKFYIVKLIEGNDVVLEENISLNQSSKFIPTLKEFSNITISEDWSLVKSGLAYMVSSNDNKKKEITVAVYEQVSQNQ